MSYKIIIKHDIESILIIFENKNNNSMIYFSDKKCISFAFCSARPFKFQNCILFGAAVYLKIERKFAFCSARQLIDIEKLKINYWEKKHIIFKNMKS